MDIRHLKHNEIDTLRWDKHIRDSFNGVVYAFSWYLDIVSDGWEALVADNYNYLMPLPVKHTLGIDYVNMPKFINQLGIFTKKKLTQDIADAFLRAIPYPFFNYKLNLYNPFSEADFFRVKTHTNYRTDLITAYPQRKKKYSKEFKARTAQAISQQTIVQAGIQPNNFLTFMQDEVQLPKKFHQDDIDNLRRIIVSAIRYRVGVLYGAFSRENQLCAVAFFIGSHNKTFLLSAGANKTGQKNNALYLILDVYFENSSEYNMTLDFDGLKVGETELICQGAGARPYTLRAIDQNNMPWYVKFLKL